MTERVNAGDNHLSLRGGGEEETDKPKDPLDVRNSLEKKCSRKEEKGCVHRKGRLSP